jgi:hypothetical protein
MEGKPEWPPRANPMSRAWQLCRHRIDDRPDRRGDGRGIAA